MKCFKCFHISYAPILDDGKGHRAAEVGDEAEIETF